MTMNQTGALAQFSINGKATTAATNQISGVIPGATINLLGTFTADEQATLTVAANAAPIANALQSFVGAYNTLRSAVQSQTGTNNGALQGSELLRAVQQQMQQLVNYQGSGSVQSLSDLGVSVAEDGTMSLDTSVLSAMSPQQLSGALAFIGDGTTTGLSALSANFSSYSDSTTGVIQQSILDDQTSEQNLQTQIDNMSARITASQQAETARIEAADAALAKLESQQSELTSSITSLNYTLYGTSMNNTANPNL
jgi:flagellar hook-associated protein 2